MLTEYRPIPLLKGEGGALRRVRGKDLLGTPAPRKRHPVAAAPLPILAFTIFSFDER
jgi:hypothetical protein